LEANREEQIVLKQPRSFDERRAAARILTERLRYRIPLAIDSMDNRAETAFAGWPERIYILGTGGRILYKGGMGPFGFLPEEAEESLRRILTPPT